MKSIRTKALPVLLLCALLALAGCSADGGSADEGRGNPYGTADSLVAIEDFPRMDGSTANIPLLRALAQYYTGISQEEAELLVQVSTTDYAYYALLDGSADLVIAYEPAEPTVESFQYYDSSLAMKPIGLDALVFICNDGNPVADLSREELVGIYTGSITNWSEVGGDDVAIVPYQRVERSGSQTMMLKLVMGDTPIMDAPSDYKPGGMGGLVDQILEYDNTANALGYSVYYYIQNMYAFPEIRMLSIDGVMPNNASIQDGSYPYVNEFFAVIREDEPQDSLARQMYDFLSTPEGKALIEAAGYVPVP